jgi:Zn-dependent alcohol dehydrogenase
MHKNKAITAGAAALGMTLALATAQVATAAAPHATAAAAGQKVTVTIQGRTKTLLNAEKFTTPTGSITNGGVAVGKCPGDTAQGALQVATLGNWKGKWYASYHEYYITAILGDSETTKKYYWALYVNGKSSSKGACDVKVKTGDKLLFKVVKG